MSLRVNLMRQDELRHPSGWDRADVIRLASVVGVVLVAAVIGLLVARQAAFRAQLRSARARWAVLQDRNAELVELRARMQRDEHLLAQLRAWQTTRVEWNRILGELPGAVPPIIQVTRLTMLGEIDVPRPAGPRADPADVGPPRRTHKLVLNGRVVGARADEEMEAFESQMSRVPGLTDRLESAPIRGPLTRDANPTLARVEHQFVLDLPLRAQEVALPRAGGGGGATP